MHPQSTPRQRQCAQCGSVIVGRRDRTAIHVFCSRDCHQALAKQRAVEGRESRFWSKVDKNGPVPAIRPDLGSCWVWTKALNKGYGAFGDGHKKVRGSHIVAYELLIGQVPDGLELDHLCRNHACVNPSHLEPVTHRENTMRGLNMTAIEAVVTHCPQGHPYDEANTTIRGGKRFCRECARIAKRLDWKRSTAVLSQRRKERRERARGV